MLALVLAASLAPAQQPTGYRLPPQQSRQRFALEFDVETVVRPRFYRVPEMADRDYCPMPQPQPRYYANGNGNGGGGCYGGEPYGGPGGYANGNGGYRNGNGYAAPPPPQRQRYYDNSRYYEGPCPPSRAVPPALPRIGVRESYGP